MWLLFTSPKKLHDISEEEKPFLKIVRPFNFILICFIFFGFALEITGTDSVTKFFTEEGQEQSEIFNNLKELDGTSLVIRFLPFIIFFIMVSKLLEKVLNRFLEAPKKLSIVYLYAVGFSCFLFFLTIFLVFVYSEYATDYTSLDLDVFLIVLALIFLIYQVMYPSFLMSRALKYQGVVWWGRTINFFGITSFIATKI